MVRSLMIMGALAEAADDFGMLQATKLAEEQSTMLKTDSSAQQSLTALSRSQDPRRASELLQEFAMNTLEAGQGLDADTKQKLIAIRDILTNETYIALEQAHRSDQDLLVKHANAINECGEKHIRHLQQDVEGQEVQLVRDMEDAMYKCRGLPHHSLSALQTEETKDCDPADPCANGCGDWETCATDGYGNYDPDKDPTGDYALQAVRAHPNDDQILKGVWRSGAYTDKGHRYWKTWAGVNDPKYDDPEWAATGSCLAAHTDMFARCDALDAYIRGLPKPNCNPPVGSEVMEPPQCGGKDIVGVDSDLEDWFSNMKTNARFYQEEWRALKKACFDAIDYYKKICKECDKKQHNYEQAFCTYRQSLHGTCREYQGCHVLNEKEFKDLVKKVMYNSDSRKIDWKAIHKIECYINVLISNANNTIRAKDLLNCEAGNLNTIETILTGFNETNYLSLIVPTINVSCWDLDVPSYIDFKECDMTSVRQHPCTESWMTKYTGLKCVAECTECSPIPDDFQYHMELRDKSAGFIMNESYGGGWYFVNEVGRDLHDINDLQEITAGGYHLPNYVVSGLQWNEVLIERVSENWCDSWGRQSSYWKEDGGASMCIQSDNEHVYCMSNAHGEHSWRQQPASHFTVNCGGDGQPKCECWPKADPVCWAYQAANASGPTLENKPAPRSVRILSLKDDGSVVKISFQGASKSKVLKVGNYFSFMQDGEGCRAISDVKYRVFVRCLGCSTKEDEFHTKEGIQMTSAMNIGKMADRTRSEYTYEAWFESPMYGQLRREIVGGASSGLTLVNEAQTPCMHEVAHGLVADGKQERGYQLHAGSTNKYGSICLRPKTWYHGAVTKDLNGTVQVYINGKAVTAEGKHIHATDSGDSTLALTLGGGFVDGGQLFNVRIWNHARTQTELYQDAFKTEMNQLSHVNGLDHWWPLTDDLKDVITGMPLSGEGNVRSSPIWCSDLEKSGMTGC